MTDHTQLMSEGWAIVGVVDPDAYSAATTLSAAVDMASYTQVMVVGIVGDIASTGKVDLKITQAATSGGTYKDVTGKAITQLTQASPDDSNQQVIINCDQTDLDMDNDYRYIKASITGTTAAADTAVLILGLPKRRPASAADLASVAEIIG